MSESVLSEPMQDPSELCLYPQLPFHSNLLDFHHPLIKNYKVANQDFLLSFVET